MLKKFIEAMTIFISSCFAFILVASSVLLVYSFVIEEVKKQLRISRIDIRFCNCRRLVHT